MGDGQTRRGCSDLKAWTIKHMLPPLRWCMWQCSPKLANNPTPNSVAQSLPRQLTCPKACSCFCGALPPPLPLALALAAPCRACRFACRSSSPLASTYSIRWRSCGTEGGKN